MSSMRPLLLACVLAAPLGCASDSGDPGPDQPITPHLGETTCVHDLCATGDPVDPTCHPCAGDICAVDSFCCDYAWDGVCVAEVATVCGETCSAGCGDGVCGLLEDCRSCPADCGGCSACGDGVCDWGEDCTSCGADCGACPACDHDHCTAGTPLASSCDTCTADICAIDPFCCAYAWDVLCVSEATTICGETCGSPIPPGCGDGVCSLLEDCSSCAADCGACTGCGDGVCDPASEDCATCPGDCGSGGICGSCGDGVCAPAEDCGTCPADCGGCTGCAHDLCVTGSALDERCDPCAAIVCAADAFCCTVSWDAFCITDTAACPVPCP